MDDKLKLAELMERGGLCVFDRSPLKYSSTLNALCEQLNVDYKAEAITKKTMSDLSKLGSINFVIIESIDFDYDIDRKANISIIDNGFEKTMVIYTSEKYMVDNVKRLTRYIKHYQLAGHDMYHEYLLTYSSINKATLTGSETYDPQEDIAIFDEYHGTRYDAAINLAMNVLETEHKPIYEENPMPLNEFVLYIMRHVVGLDIIIVIIFNQEYYVLGDYGTVGYSILEIKNDEIIVPVITTNELLARYTLGDPNKLMSCVTMLK